MNHWLPDPSVWLEALVIIQGADDIQHKLKGLATSFGQLSPKVIVHHEESYSVPFPVKFMASLLPYFKPTVRHLLQNRKTAGIQTKWTLVPPV